MARHHGARNREPHPVPPSSRRVVKKASKILSRFGGEIRLPSLLTVRSNVVRSFTASSRIDLALCRIALSARCDSTISAFSPDMPTARSRLPLASMQLAGNRLLRSATTGTNSVRSFCGRLFGPGELAQPLRHRL